MGPGGLSGLWTSTWNAASVPSLGWQHAAVPRGSYAMTVGATEDFQPVPLPSLAASPASVPFACSSCDAFGGGTEEVGAS